MKNVRSYPFAFTGKERDEETGYGYFGARYMDHELMTMWLSVDPMADKYPSISPYAYCAWNPVKLVDPDGEEIWIVNKEGNRIKYLSGMNMDGYDKYTKETIRALNKLSTTKTLGSKIKILCETSQFSIDITESEGETEWIPNKYDNTNDYLPQNQSINFDPSLGIEDIFTEEIMSPANCLGHELGHLCGAIENPKDFFTRLSQKRSDEWSNNEELNNII